MKNIRKGASARLLKNYITTAVGLALWGFAGYMIMEAVNNGEAVMDAAKGMSGWLITGGLLLRSKDSLLGFASKDAVKEIEDATKS